MSICRDCNAITPTICAHGKPCAAVLTDRDLQLFTQAQLSVPSSRTATEYSKVHLLSVNRVITSKSAYKGFLRDNSGTVFLKTGEVCYGRLLKFVVFENGAHKRGYVFIQFFMNKSEKLAEDCVTTCCLDDHIVSLYPPR